MSTLSVKVERLTIEPHENADALEIARVGDFQSIVRKGQYKTGDLAAYIPEQALVPQYLLREMGLEGRLAGKEKNRVKAVKLRGVLSQGIVYPARSHWEEGQDVTHELGIEKWEPPVPPALAGEVYSVGAGLTLKYDIENIKKFPHVIEPGEPVVMTEKIHGTWCCFGVLPKGMGKAEKGSLIVTSKGLSARNLSLDPTSENNQRNIYLRAARQFSAEEQIRSVFSREILERDQPVYVLGEVFGKGIQDLNYGANSEHDDMLGFRVFDIYVGMPNHGRYLNHDELNEACKQMSFKRVPVLYEGPFNKSKMLELTSGTEAVSGAGKHLREGVVVRPQVEREAVYDGHVQRVQFKSVSEAYLMRKNGTEFN